MEVLTLTLFSHSNLSGEIESAMGSKGRGSEAHSVQKLLNYEAGKRRSSAGCEGRTRGNGDVPAPRCSMQA
jgi:hypothetical protein